jgi:hypothetical protein
MSAPLKRAKVVLSGAHVRRHAVRNRPREVPFNDEQRLIVAGLGRE